MIKEFKKEFNKIVNNIKANYHYCRN